MARRVFSAEFKTNSTSLVVDQGYKVKDACRTVGVGVTAMERWVKQLREEQQGITPAQGKTITPEQQRILELESKIRRIEREKDILKKATALLMSDSLSQ
tara:strand:- start:479 stop:778 length:300 start_codon:yes stop_codon:yes gene_type:complete